VVKIMGQKILLITPPYHCGVLESAGRWLPLNFVYLAGELRKAGHEVVIYDAMTKFHDLEQIREKIKTVNPDIVGSTAYTSIYKAAMDVLKIAKEIDEEITTIVGGAHPTFCYQEVFAEYSTEVDFIIRGEGERTVVELVDQLTEGNIEDSSLQEIAGLAYESKGEIVVAPQRELISDLDTIETAWDLLEWEDYTYFMVPGSRLAAISTSRGCDHECSFCSQQKMWRQEWRARDVENVIDEILYLYNEFEVDVFLIADEYPTKDRERWEAFLDELIALDLDAYFLMETRVEDIVRDEDIIDKYKAAGVIHIYVGVEATSQETLDRFKKDIKVEESQKALQIIHSVGIVSETSFVLGTPEETKESIAATLELAKHYDPDFAHFLLLAPWPYADIYEEVEDYIEVDDYEKYNLVEAVISPEEMEIDELFDEVINCYKEFYMQKLPKWFTIKDKFKQKYVFNSMKKMLQSSFLQHHMQGLGEIPDKVQKYLDKIKKII
jgi:anaerobic magnesium-protoporphyrin IX monomethyl ester cyclase